MLEGLGIGIGIVIVPVGVVVEARKAREWQSPALHALRTLIPISTLSMS